MGVNRSLSLFGLFVGHIGKKVFLLLSFHPRADIIKKNANLKDEGSSNEEKG